MRHPVHLRTVRCGTHRIVNRSHYRTDDLLALVGAVEGWYGEPHDPLSPPEGDPRPLLFVSARGMLETARAPSRASLGARAFSDGLLYRWIRKRGPRMIALTTPHGPDAHPGAAAALARPDGRCSEAMVCEIAGLIAFCLHAGNTIICSTPENVPAHIAALPVRVRPARGVVVHARVRNGMLLARARAAEARAHESVLALQDAAFHAHRASQRLMRHTSTSDVLGAYHHLISVISTLEFDLERARVHLGVPSRPARIPPHRAQFMDVDGPAEIRDGRPHRAPDRVQAPTATLRGPPGPYVSALGTLEIENHTVYATADLLALVDRVEAAAARWQGTDAPPRVARRVQATTPRGHLPRLSFVHLPWERPDIGSDGVLPLLACPDRSAETLATVPLRRPDARIGDPLRLLACGPPRVSSRDLGLLAQRIALEWSVEPRSHDWIDPRGLRLRVARHASASLRWGGPTARRRAARACAVLREAVEAVGSALTEAVSCEREVTALLRALHTMDRRWSRDDILRARLRDLERMLERAEWWVNQPAFRT